MTTQDWKKYIPEAIRSLERKELKNAFIYLNLLIADLQDWQLQEKLNELENTYKSMLQYMARGAKDPARDSIYHDLLRSAYQLADVILLKFQTKNTSGYYFEKKRIMQASYAGNTKEMVNELEEICGKIALNSLLDDDDNKVATAYQLSKERENMTTKLFHHVWLSDKWTNEDKDLISGLINNQLYPKSTQCIIVTALTLSLLSFFDENKLIVLFDAFENHEEEIRQRALIGILLVLRKYDKLLYLYPEINNRLQHLTEDKQFIRNVREIILHFILSKDTEKINRKITEELIPEMMKNNPILSNKIKLEDLINESGIDDKNPEWQNMIEESGLNKKLQEFSELQMEGADVMHSSFAHLKSYSFFNEISNWFLPFSSDYSGFYESTKNNDMKQMLDTLSNSIILCNSDKYSLYFSISQMPEAYRKMVGGQFAAETEALKEMQKEELPDHNKKASIIANLYIRDLYRFFKLHPRRKDFEDIFEVKSDFDQTTSIGNLVSDTENLMIIGEYYFNRDHFNEAVKVFNQLLNSGAANDVLYQKIGYCMQMTGDMEKALDAYLKAELLNPSNSWTIKKLAYCYRLSKKPEEALHYYRKAEQLNPDNLSIQLSIGHCFLELKNYTEALKCYFKVEYLDKNGSKAWRPIAWCSFLTEKYEQAQTYFQKIYDSGTSSPADYLNGGHVQFALGNIQETIRLYKMSIQHPDSSIEKFHEAFNNDLNDLLQTGVSEKDIPLVLDLLQYEV